MSDYAPLLRRLIGGEHLAEAECAELIGAAMDGTRSPAQTAGLLVAMAAKGESAQEILGAARAMRSRATHVEHGLDRVLDIVGTGGDGANTINLSTLAALVCAAAGVPVAKHGNRAASSACGSADVLEAAGFPLDLSPARAAGMLRAAGFTFLFAPRYHPAMREVAPVRRELGVRTIFNVLGPLANPARATYCVVGTARLDQVELLGEVLRALGVRRGAVIHASTGMDEIAGDAPTHVYSFDPEGARRWSLDPAAFGIDVPPAALAGGSVAACVEAFFAILGGERSPRSDVVALNAALGLVVAEAEPSLEAALARARGLLASGAALAAFERAKAFAHV